MKPLTLIAVMAGFLNHQQDQQSAPLARKKHLSESVSCTSEMILPYMCQGLNSLYWAWSSHLSSEVLITGIYKPPTIGLMTIPN